MTIFHTISELQSYYKIEKPSYFFKNPKIEIFNNYLSSKQSYIILQLVN